MNDPVDAPLDLRSLFLFEALDDEQLAWVAEHSGHREFVAGSQVVSEGDPADRVYLLLSGTIAMSRIVGTQPVEISRTDQRGVSFGAMQFFLDSERARRYPTSVRAVTACRVLDLPARELGTAFRSWFPMAVHLLEGMAAGLHRNEQITAERERLLALGTLSAGLTHELNNPAAAVGRAADALGEKLTGLRTRFTTLVEGAATMAQLRALMAAQDVVVRAGREPLRRTPIEIADHEDALSEWLQDAGVATAWELAPVFVAGGVGAADLAPVAAAVDPTVLEEAMGWLADTIESQGLLGELTDAAARICQLVLTAKQYSQLDRAPHQLIDVHEGIEATLAMFGRKLAAPDHRAAPDRRGDGIRIVRDYAPDLPRVPAWAAELNQVWTNIIDNAVDAMTAPGSTGSGTLTVRTARDGDRVLVEIADTGPGVPPEVRSRIFEPFFTTKGVGHGTGLGLDISYRTVVTRHHGDLAVVSQPGDTRFQIRLPVTEYPS